MSVTDRGAEPPALRYDERPKRGFAAMRTLFQHTLNWLRDRAFTPRSQKRAAVLDDLLEKIVQAIRQNDEPHALRLWETIRKHFPKEPRVYESIGQALRETNRLDLAGAVLAEGTDRCPQEFSIALEYARVAMLQRDLAAAQHRWSEMRARFPDHPTGYTGAGEASIWAGDLDAAEAILGQARVRFPDDLWSALHYAHVATAKENWAEAHRRWESVYLNYPDQQVAWEQSGQALQVLGRLYEAESVFDEASKRFPDSEEIAIRYEELVSRRRSWPDAQAAWEVFRQRFPDFRSTNRQRRTALRQQIAAKKPSTATCQPLYMAESDRWFCGTVISEDPVIILAAEPPFDIVKNTEKYYQDRKVYYLTGMLWSASADASIRQQYAQDYHAITEAHPNLDITILANDDAELQAMRAIAVPAKLANHNIFCDENLYNIIDTPQIYDAVYTARFGGYKRHHLAADIGSLLLILTWPTEEDTAAVRTLLPAAEIANRHGGPLRNLEPHEVVQKLNSARCGLCLSAIEGAMFASMEYLLCGLPVVTTHNSGGRDFFFSDEYAFYCEDDAASVRNAVELAAARGQSRTFREYIRKTAITSIRRERENFYGIVNDIFAKNGQPDRRIEEELAVSFFDKMNYRGRPLGEFLVP